MGGMGLTVGNSLPSSDVYVAAKPLRATKGPPQLFMSAAYSVYLSWDLQHFMVLSTSPALPSQALVFDFQPQDPESIDGGSTCSSIWQENTWSFANTEDEKIAKTRCWMVGSCNVDVEEAIQKFNANWDTDLIVGQHDCRHYTNGLVECLTGEKYVLDRLRRSEKSIT